MTNLCALSARFTNEMVSEYRSTRTRNNIDDEMILCKDEDIQWLVNQLTPTCAIGRHPFCVNHIRIWIK
ncbi:unnamed protein product [Adineta steineri]|uniref:Uncharacterized protein n=1 Tax=Adineta steineri TaxID=433720 RepID=A0A815UB93_9BILA|nr:unnamed protein product [Adineta steineri]CAF1649114.1 unnamed protein product [Adineta steineri]